jgi:hypothetical protein
MRRWVIWARAMELVRGFTQQDKAGIADAGK